MVHGEGYHSVVRQLDGKNGGPCYSHHVRVRAGATIVVALTVAVHTRAWADGSAATARAANSTVMHYPTVATEKSHAVPIEPGWRLVVKW